MRRRRELITEDMKAVQRSRLWLPMTRRELGLSVAYLSFVTFGMLLSYFTGGREDVLPGLIGVAALIGVIVCVVQLVRATWQRRVGA